MPEHPPPPPPPKTGQDTMSYIEEVVNGEYTDSQKVKAIKKALK